MNPGPESYNIKGIFEKDSIIASKKYTFGMSRESYQKVKVHKSNFNLKVYMKNHPAKDKSLPGPGAYSPDTKLG